MDRILFVFYYLKLRLEVLTGIRQTGHPLEIGWRWTHWQRTRKNRRVKLL